MSQIQHKTQAVAARQEAAQGRSHDPLSGTQPLSAGGNIRPIHD